MAEEQQLRRRGSGLLRSREFWILNSLAIVAVIGVLTNGFLQFYNKSLRSEVSQNQQFLNKSIKLSQLNQQLIQSLANLAAKTGDESIRSLLFSQGISYSVNPAPPAANAGKK